MIDLTGLDIAYSFLGITVLVACAAWCFVHPFMLFRRLSYSTNIIVTICTLVFYIVFVSLILGTCIGRAVIVLPNGTVVTYTLPHAYAIERVLRYCGVFMALLYMSITFFMLVLAVIYRRSRT